VATLWPATTGGAAVVEGATRGEVGRGLADGRGAGLAGRVLEGARVGLELTDPLWEAGDGTVEVSVAGAVERASGAPQPASVSSAAMATGNPALRRIPTGSSSAGPGAAARVVGPGRARASREGRRQSHGRATWWSKGRQCGRQKRPTISPSSSRSMLAAAGCLGRPGMVRISPLIA